MEEHDFDWIVIGSGFGGSVSALRLAEKGYKVAVLEAGRRYRDEDFAKTTWNARKYYWLPRLGLRLRRDAGGRAEACPVDPALEGHPVLLVAGLRHLRP